MYNKAYLRQMLKTKRMQLSQEEQLAASIRLTRNIINLPIFKQAKHIAAYSYLQATGEINLNPLISYALCCNKSCYLPVLLPKPNKSLIFKEYLPWQVNQTNQYGILEPVSGRIIACNELDIVFVPLLAFDLSGNRLGFGGGYYDATFSALNINRTSLIGVGYSWQLFDTELPSEEHDLKLSAAVTDMGMYWFANEQ